MTQREDLDVLAMVAHQQRAQQGEHVGHSEIGQSQQHDRPSCRGDHQPREYPAPRQTLTCMDEVSGKRNGRALMIGDTHPIADDRRAATGLSRLRHSSRAAHTHRRKLLLRRVGAGSQIRVAMGRTTG